MLFRLALVISTLLGLTSIHGNVQLPNWKSIVPIESTASDVRKQWGVPDSLSPDFYAFKDYNILISYSSGAPCESKCIELGYASGWNVPRDTLITAAFMIKPNSIYLKDLDIDLSKFKRERASDYGGGVYFSSEEKGIGITVEGDQIATISLFPAKKYFHLMCNGLGENRPTCPKITSDPSSISGEVLLRTDKNEA